MSGELTMPALGRAIAARAATRDALDRDDMPMVRVLNRCADALYLRLNQVEAALYMAWAREETPAVSMLTGGDA